MGIYYAYLDRAPVLVIGATLPPLSEPKRGPHRLDPFRTFQVEAILHILKWDSSTVTIGAVPERLPPRAYSS